MLKFALWVIEKHPRTGIEQGHLFGVFTTAKEATDTALEQLESGNWTRVEIAAKEVTG